MTRHTLHARSWRISRGSAAILVTVVSLSSSVARGQEPSEVQRMFEAGQYQHVVDAAGPESGPAVVFMAALSAQKLAAADGVTAFLQRLVQRPPEDAWHFVGLSATQLLAGDDQAALESARQATAADMSLPEASYELGLVLAKRQEWAAAAAAFDRAATLHPSFAYAHYYDGLAHDRANRPDQMAIRFERFLKLAPDAPERTEVVQVMRTVRGR